MYVLIPFLRFLTNGEIIDRMKHLCSLFPSDRKVNQIETAMKVADKVAGHLITPDVGMSARNTDSHEYWQEVSKAGKY